MSKKLNDLTDEDFAFQNPDSATKAAPPISSGMQSLRGMLDKPVVAQEGGEKQAGGYVNFVQGTFYPVGSFLIMPLEHVIENPRNPRVYFNEEDLVSLQLSLSTSGQQEAAKVFFDTKSGKYMLKSGHRRFRSLGLLGKPSIKVELVESKNPLEEFREARELNTEAKGQSHLDDAVRFPELMAEFNLGQKDISKKMNMSEAEVSKRIKIGTLPRSVLDKLADNISAVGVEACYRFALINERTGEAGLEQLHKLIARTLEGKVSIAQLREISDEAKAGAAGTTSTTAGRRKLPVARAELKGAAAGAMKAFDNRIEIMVEKLAPELRDKLYDAFHGVLAQAGLIEGQAPLASTTSE